MDAFIKMAIASTALDTCQLLIRLRATAPESEHKNIDEIISRLTTMASTL